MIYIGIDVGGTAIKGIAIDEAGEVKAEGKVDTGGKDVFCDNIALLIGELLKGAKTDEREVAGVGVGCPGMIDSENGVVVFAGNLGLKNFPLAGEITARTGFSVKVTNDANAAALGEARFGAGVQFSNSILVTLGTGVGGGIVVGGKLFEGGRSAGAEIGHMVVKRGGYPCTCGRKGCFECYASATALIRKTREAMIAHEESAMWRTYDVLSACGKTAFDYSDVDEAAREVVDWYIENLACGITNLANVFRPEIILLGGGVSEQGEKLTAPLQKLLDEEIFAGQNYAPVKVAKASLGNRAGALGAAALAMERRP